MSRIGCILAVLALAACSKTADKPATPSDAVLAAWKAEKLAPSGLAAAPVAFAKDCRGGTIENLDVLLCNFATPAEAKAAEAQGNTWIGSATGSAQARGSVLVVLADRKKADPNGRTINKLMKLAPK
ncbi:MAG TPA: hypothetical protein VF469_17795 [Kofleriaceae bacterium]